MPRLYGRADRCGSWCWGFRDGACPVCTVGQVGAGRGIGVVETGHSPSLPDRTGTEQGWNRNRTGTEQGWNRNRGRNRGRAACGAVVETICKSERWKMVGIHVQ